jgi:5-methylcytosine-specific restriction endonuclease McrA
VLIKCNWSCVDCGKVDVSLHADHVMPISQGGDRYDTGNGQARCASCHARKTVRERENGGRIGSLGRAVS